MLISVIWFAVGLVLLIKGGDWFVDGASGIAHKFNMPELLIGATVVSIGTTLPEVMVSAQSAITGHGEIAYGNAIGSIICNTALIAAITIAVAPALVNRVTLVKPVAFFFVAATFYSAVAYVLGYFSRVTGIILLIMFAVYMILTVRDAFKTDGGKNASIENEDTDSDATYQGIKNKLGFQIIMLIVGAVMIAIGADLLVEHGTKIATFLGVPESVIALTFVALGTSLPELVTAVTSLIKKCGALSLGNVIGANIFNIVLVSGVSCTLSPFEIPRTSVIAGKPASLVLEIPVMLVVMSILTIPALVKGKLYRAQGVILLCIYVLFCGTQFLI